MDTFGHFQIKVKIILDLEQVGSKSDIKRYAQAVYQRPAQRPLKMMFLSPIREVLERSDFM